MGNELNSIIDQLLINTTQNTVQLQLIEQGMIELAKALLSKEHSYNFQTHYLNNLKDKTAKAVSDLSKVLHEQKASFRANVDTALSIQHRLKELDNED